MLSARRFGMFGLASTMTIGFGGSFVFTRNANRALILLLLVPATTA
jgi:hypothetical protein